MRPSVAGRQPALHTASWSRQSCRAVAHIHTQAHGLPLLPLLAHCYEVMLRCCCQTTAGGLTGAATENTYGAGDRTGREKIKENGPFRHFLTNLFRRPKEYNAESPPNNQRDRGVRQSRQWQRGGGAALPPATAAAAAASGKPCRDSGTSAPDTSGGPSWATEETGNSLNSSEQTSDVCFYLFPLSKRFH